MTIVRGSTFRAERPWGAIEIADMDGITTRLHWSDKPYHWHVNVGEEVFVVLSGRVVMYVRDEGREYEVALEAGDIFHATSGIEHFAHPVGAARILVVERRGSA